MARGNRLKQEVLAAAAARGIMSQRELADRIGRPLSTLNELLNQPEHRPNDPQIFYELQEVLGLDAHDMARQRGWDYLPVDASVDEGFMGRLRRLSHQPDARELLGVLSQLDPERRRQILAFARYMADSQQPGDGGETTSE